ncbi:MAG: PTS transporter subunit EIIC [Culicoidibacterales bacterium]
MKQAVINKTAQAVLVAIGGNENLISAAHCATRLRIVLKDEAKVDQQALEQLELVKGTFQNAGQFQIIFGSGTVNTVYNEFIAIAKIQPATKAELKQAATKKLSPLQRLVKVLADVFVPLLPVLIASGLLMGINNMLTASGLFIEGMSVIQAYPAFADFADIVNLFANAAYIFLPVFIGFSATKIFGGNPYLGAVIGMIMVHPDLLNGYGYGEAVTNGTVPVWTLFDFEIVKVGYQGTVLPIIAAAFLLAKTELGLRRFIPEYLDNLLTPLFAVFITGILTFILIGPVMREAGNLLTVGIMWMFETFGLIGAGVYGALNAPLTVTGMHHSLFPIEIQLLAATGGSFLFAITSCNNVAQGAAAFAALLVNSDKKLKGIAISSGISALLGITEPAMFGVNLKLKYPFVAAMCGTFFGAIYVTYMNVTSIAPGPAGIIGFVSLRPTDILHFFIGLAITMLCTLAFTVIFAKVFANKQSFAKAKQVIASAKKVVQPSNS